MFQRNAYDASKTNFRASAKGQIICLMLALISAFCFPAVARAQFLPSQSNNRMICEDLGSLRALLSHLDDATDLQNRNYAGPHEKCNWRKGTGYFTEAEIGKPLGWLFVNPSYIAMVHTASFDGKFFLHASIIRSQSGWRLAPGCDYLRKGVLLANGEKPNLFGTRAGVVIPSCMELVNPQIKTIVVGTTNNGPGSGGAGNSGARSAPATGSVQSQSCSNAQWSGVVSNLADLFECDPTRAIQFMAQGQSATFKVDDVAFVDGKFVARMSQQPSRISKSVQQMQQKFNWSDWSNATERSRSFSFQCKFSVDAGARLKQGGTITTRMKLITYTRETGLFDCG